MKEIFEYLALGVSLAAGIPYIIEIIQGKTKPERVSWFLWMVLGSVYFFSTIVDEGATIYTFGEILGPTIIFILALKYGVGGKSRFDLISLAVALVALGLLIVSDDALISLLLALSVDFIGLSLTIRKLRLDPTSESKLAWGLSAISGVLALISLESYNLVSTLFPVYVVLACGTVWYLAHPGKPHTEKIEEL